MRFGFLVTAVAISTPAVADVTADEATAVYSILQRESVSAREDRYAGGTLGLVVSSVFVGLGVVLVREEDGRADTTGKVLIASGAASAVASTYLFFGRWNAEHQFERFNDQLYRDPSGSVRRAREAIAKRATRAERNGTRLRIAGYSILGASVIGTTIALMREQYDVAVAVGVGGTTLGATFAVVGHVPNSDERTHAKLLAVKSGAGVAFGGSF